MKKLVFLLMTLFALGMYSCGNTETTETVNDSIDTTMVDTVVVDSTAVDTAKCNC